jgi:hypothetical protein
MSSKLWFSSLLRNSRFISEHRYMCISSSNNGHVLERLLSHLHAHTLVDLGTWSSYPISSVVGKSLFVGAFCKCIRSDGPCWKFCFWNKKYLVRMYTSGEKSRIIVFSFDLCFWKTYIYGMRCKSGPNPTILSYNASTKKLTTPRIA